MNYLICFSCFLFAFEICQSFNTELSENLDLCLQNDFTDTKVFLYNCHQEELILWLESNVIAERRCGERSSVMQLESGA